MTLTDFLLARIAEDGADLPEGFDCWYPPERYMAECEAKRRIVEYRISEGYADDGMVAALRALATVYSDHKDFDEGWRADA